jgi:hypothetical protein
MGLWLPVQGTAGLPKDVTKEWWYRDSPLVKELASVGHELIDPDDQFVWSTDIDGVFGNDRDWYAGGKALRYYLRTVPLKDRNIICHSHGLQVVLFACADIPSLPINSLISVCSPVRKDMEQVAIKARPFIGHWRQIYYDGWDWWQRFGSLFDREFSLRRRHPLADVNTPAKGIHHSDLLKKAKHVPMWSKNNWTEPFDRLCIYQPAVVQFDQGRDFGDEVDA